MQSINYRTARGNFTEKLNSAEASEDIEITRRSRESPVNVSNNLFDTYKKAALDPELSALFDELDESNKLLVDR